MNGEAIYGTRPWKTYGDGGAIAAAARGGGSHHQAGAFNEAGRKPLTRERHPVHAEERRAVRVRDGPARRKGVDPVCWHRAASMRSVRSGMWRCSGAKGKLNWSQEGSGLTIQTAARTAEPHAVVFKVTGA